MKRCSVITREACVMMQRAACARCMMLDDSREWLDLRASYGAGRGLSGKGRV